MKNRDILEKWGILPIGIAIMCIFIYSCARDSWSAVNIYSLPDGREFSSSSEERYNKDNIENVPDKLEKIYSEKITAREYSTIANDDSYLSIKPLTVLTNVSEAVRGFAISRDGRYLAAVFRHDVRVWETESWRLVAIIHEKGKSYLYFSPDDGYLAVISGNRMRIWETGSWKYIGAETIDAHLWDGALLFSQDGKFFAYVFSNHSINVIQTTLWDKLKKNSHKTGGDSKPWKDNFKNKDIKHIRRLCLVNTISFSPKGDLLAIGCDDGSIEILDTTEWKLLEKITGHNSSVRSLSFSSDSRLLVSGSENGYFKIWETKTWSLLQDIKGHTSSIDAVIFSIWDKYLVTGSVDKSIKIWSIKTLLGDYQYKKGNSYENVKQKSSVKGDKESIDEKIRDSHSLLLHKDAISPQQRLWAVAVDEKYIYIGSDDWKVGIYDINTLKLVKMLDDHRSPVSDIFVDEESLYTASWDKTVIVYDKNKDFLKLAVLKKHTNRISSIFVDNEYIYTASYDTKAIIWHKYGFYPVKTLSDHTDYVTAITADENRIYTGSADMKIKIYDKNEKLPIAVVSGILSPVVDMMNDRDYLYVALSSKVIIVVNKTDFQQKAVLSTATDIASIYVSPSFIYCGTSSGYVYMWDKSKFELKKKFKAHMGAVKDLTATIKYLITVSNDGHIKIWLNPISENSCGVTLDKIQQTEKITIQVKSYLNSVYNDVLSIFYFFRNREENTTTLYSNILKDIESAVKDVDKLGFLVSEYYRYEPCQLEYMINTRLNDIEEKINEIYELIIMDI